MPRCSWQRSAATPLLLQFSNLSASVSAGSRPPHVSRTRASHVPLVPARLAPVRGTACTASMGKLMGFGAQEDSFLNKPERLVQAHRGSLPKRGGALGCWCASGAPDSLPARMRPHGCRNMERLHSHTARELCAGHRIRAQQGMPPRFPASV